MEKKDDYLKGRGAQNNPNNRFIKNSLSKEHIEGLDEELLSNEKTQVIFTHPKTIINKVESPDIGMAYSLNPYQGCEHGCIYCYARNTHEYWGYSAGLDFERKIIIKENVVEVLEKQLSSKTWEPLPIMLSGNTDCYQPVERKYELTRKILETCLKFKHPIGVITKNALILRDRAILMELAKFGLVRVMISITGLEEDTRLLLEPRTSTYQNRLKIIKTLSSVNIPTGVMIAPIIPGINNHEIVNVMEQASLNGADSAGYSIVRLNGAIGDIFKDWLYKTFPYRAEKVWNQICDCHGGTVSDSRLGTRMKGEGKIAENIKQLYNLGKQKYFKHKQSIKFNDSIFDYKAGDAQLKLF